jgi:hypothetical protein
MFIGFLFWRRRRKNKKAMLDKPGIELEKEPSVSAPLGSNWGQTYQWDAKASLTTTSKYKESVDVPQPVYVRPGTSNSNRAMPTRAPFAPPNKQTAPNATPIYITTASSPPTQRRSPMELRASSPDLPMQRPDTRPSSPSQVSSIPPYLAHMNGNPDPTKSSPQKVSRFSLWTNSQAPKTPKTPNPPVDQTRYVDSNRLSSASDAESVARYRTVESWVGQQAGRYEEARIRERIQMQLEEAIGELHRGDSTRTPNQRSRESAAKFQGTADQLKTIPLQDSSSVFIDGVEDEEGDQITDLSLIPEAARKSSVKRSASRRAKHNTNESDMTVFRAHPGTKVEIAGSRFIPSEILDSKIPPGAYQRRDSYGN